MVKIYFGQRVAFVVKSQRVASTFGQCWSSVADSGRTLTQHSIHA